MSYARTREVILTLLAYNHPSAVPNSYFADVLGISVDMVSKYTRPLFDNDEIQDFDSERKHFWMLTTKGWMKLHLRKYIGIRVDEWKCKHCSEDFKELPVKRVVTDIFGRFCDNCSKLWNADVVDFTVWKSAKAEFKAIYKYAPDEHKTSKRRRFERREALINPRPS